LYNFINELEIMSQLLRVLKTAQNARFENLPGTMPQTNCCMYWNTKKSNKLVPAKWTVLCIWNSFTKAVSRKTPFTFFEDLAKKISTHSHTSTWNQKSKL